MRGEVNESNRYEPFRVLYEHNYTPNHSNPLNTSNTPYLSEHSEHSNRFKRVKHFEPLGLLYELKEIDFNALQCVER